MNSNFHAFWLVPVTRNIKMLAATFKTFSEDETWAINEAVVQTNTTKATTFGLSVFTGRWKIIFMLNLQRNRKNSLYNAPRNVCKLLTKFLLGEVFNSQKQLSLIQKNGCLLSPRQTVAACLRFPVTLAESSTTPIECTSGRAYGQVTTKFSRMDR